jgi:hypothetical protein
MERERNLLDLVGALGALCRGARRLDRREQQGDQDADDGNHYQ